MSCPFPLLQTVSVDGYASACDPDCQRYYQISSYLGQFFGPIAQSNTALPPTNLSVYGSATDNLVLPADYTRFATSLGGASQSATVSANSIQLDMGADANFSGLPDLVTGSVDANGQFKLSFQLTSPYLVYLTGDFDEWTQADFGYQYPEVSFDGEVHLTGPGFEFSQVGPPYGLGIPYFNAVYSLAPGIYTLDAISSMGANQYYDMGSGANFDFTFTADFKPIPEPSRVSFVLG